MLLMVWIGDGFKEPRIARNTTDVLWRTFSFAFNAQRIPAAFLGFQTSFEQHLVLPAITEIVLVAELESLAFTNRNRCFARHGKAAWLPGRWVKR